MNDRDLYKAKRIDNKEWITGNYMFPDQIYDYINKIAYRIEPETVCRCTGRKDKSGKLIWENDSFNKEEKHPEMFNFCPLCGRAIDWSENVAEKTEEE